MVNYKYILLFIYCGFAFGNNHNMESTSPFVKILIPSDSLTQQQIFDVSYKDIHSEYFNLGYFTPKAVIKFEFEVSDTKKKAIQYFQSFVNKFQLFVLQDNKVVYESEITGTDVLKKNGTAPYYGFQNRYLFKLNLPKGKYSAYFKVDSPYSPIRGRIKCYDDDPDTSVYSFMDKKETWNVIVGFMSFVVFVTILMFFFSKEQVYFWFALYIVVNIANIYMLRGFTLPFYNFFPFFKYDIRVLMNTIWTLSGFIYFYHLIPLEYSNLTIRKLIKYLSAYGFALSIVFLLLPKTITHWHWLIILLKPCVFIGLIVILIHFIVAIKKQYHLAKLFLLAYSMLSIILIVHLLQILNIFKSLKYLSVLIWEISIVLELLIFILAFVYRYHLNNKEKLHLAKSLINEQNNSIKQYYEAQEKERKSIAENIHDGILQQLVSVKQGILINQKSTKSDVSDLLDITIDELRDLSHNLMPKSLIKFGLIDSIEYLLEQSFKHNNITYKYNHYDLEERLENKLELNLYRCLQELIQNTIKHSKANMVDVQFYKIKNTIILMYEDNGTGIDDKTDFVKGIGISNIQSRVNALDGTFTIENAVNSGITATIKIKLL